MKGRGVEWYRMVGILDITHSVDHACQERRMVVHSLKKMKIMAALINIWEAEVEWYKDNTCH